MAHRHDRDPASRPPLDPATNFIELRQTPPAFGLGLVDQIPDAVIMANADPDDLDGDGIRGRACARRRQHRSPRLEGQRAQPRRVFARRDVQRARRHAPRPAGPHDGRWDRHYMHDGRAGTAEQAVARHFGEATASVAAFAALSGEERAAELAFLDSL